MPLCVLSSGGTGWTCRRSGFDLDERYGPASDDVEPWPGGNLMHGLVLTGKVSGRFRQWGRAVDGRWVRQVDFTICDATSTARPWRGSSALSST